MVDAESNRKMLLKLLRKRGVEATLAEDGAEAVEMVLASATPFHLILMDNLMPSMVSTNLIILIKGLISLPVHVKLV